MTPGSNPRKRRDREVFAVTCANCRREVEVPTKPPYHCPRCGAPLALIWKEPSAK